MTKVRRVQSVITNDEQSELIKEAAYQKRNISSLIRKYITDGTKKDKLLREQRDITTNLDLSGYQRIDNKL